MTQKASLIIAAGLLFFGVGLGSVAHAQLAPFPGTKNLMEGPDPVGMGKDQTTLFTFTITLNANNFDPNNNSVMDVVPAEFNVVSTTPSCGTAVFAEREKSRRRGGRPGGKGGPSFKLAPDFILWELQGCATNVAPTLTVVVETDLNPGHAKRGIDFYEPTSCGPLFLNDGAVLVSGENDEPSTEASNALMVATCPDELDALGCADADQDGLSVACGDIEDCQPVDEICDGIDNDCDGMIDEDLGQTMCGVGECQVTVDNCVGGVPQTCAPGTPSLEICDGLDNNCNGFIDDGLLCGPDGPGGPQ